MPPIRNPARARLASRLIQPGATAPAKVSSAEHSIEAKITSRRPSPSDKGAAHKIAPARAKVATDSASELSAALTWKYTANTGSSGCAQ